MNENTELLEFPSGIAVDYETNLTPLYLEDRKVMRLKELVEKWKHIEPILASDDVTVMDLMAPPILLRFSMLAKKFGVNEGVIILQMWNHGLMTKNKNGELILVEQPKEEPPKEERPN